MKLIGILLLFIFVITDINVKVHAETKFDKNCFGQSDGFKYTNPLNCAEYYHCTAGQSALQKCPPLYFFDQQSQDCDYAQNVQCNGASTVPNCENANNGDIFPNPNDASTFFVCNLNAAVLIHCETIAKLKDVGIECFDHDLKRKTYY